MTIQVQAKLMSTGKSAEAPAKTHCTFVTDPRPDDATSDGSNCHMQVIVPDDMAADFAVGGTYLITVSPVDLTRTGTRTQ